MVTLLNLLPLSLIVVPFPPTLSRCVLRLLLSHHGCPSLLLPYIHHFYKYMPYQIYNTMTITVLFIINLLSTDDTNFNFLTVNQITVKMPICLKSVSRENMRLDVSGSNQMTIKCIFCNSILV